MQTQPDLRVLQVAGTTLISICQRIGPDYTVLHVMPQLKELFDELAFSQDITTDYGSFGRNMKVSRSKMDELAAIESHMDYGPCVAFVSFSCIPSWYGETASVLFDMASPSTILQRFHNWKVVNDICLLASGGRIASCDGTIHVWNSQTGKLISAYAEPSTHSSHLTSSSSRVSKINTDQTNMLNSYTLSGGILLSSDGS